MPIPLIIGAATLAVGGAAAGVSGTKKVFEANSRIEDASKAYKKGESKMNKKQAKSEEFLGELGALKLSAFKDLERFLNTFEKIKSRPQMKEIQEEGRKLPSPNLDAVERAQARVMNFIVVSGVGNTVTVLGNNVLGTILGTAAIAPVMAVGGLLMNSKGNDSLDKARKMEREVDKALDKMEEIISYYQKLMKYGKEMKLQIEKLLTVYNRYVSELEQIVEREKNYKKYSEGEKEIVNINIKLVSVLYNLLIQNLLEPTEEGSEELPVIKKDEIDEAIEVSEEVLVAVS